MTDDGRRGLAQRIRDEVTSIVGSNKVPPEIEAALDRETANANAEPGTEQLIDLIRTAEKAVSVTRGPNQARSFLETLSDWSDIEPGGGTRLAAEKAASAEAGDG